MSKLREYINNNSVIKDEIYKQFESSLSCSICLDIMIDPVMCMNCEAKFCKTCQEDWSQRNNTCPNRCKNPKYEKSMIAQGLLSRLKFICYKCEEVIDYEDIKNHSKINCENNTKLRVLTESRLDVDDNMEKVKSMLIYYNYIIF